MCIYTKVRIEMIEFIYVCAYFQVCLCVWCVNSQLRTYMCIHTWNMIHAVLNYIRILYILNYVLYINCVSSLDK